MIRKAALFLVLPLLAVSIALPSSSARFTDTTAVQASLFAFGTTQPIRVTTYRVNFSGDYHTISLDYPLSSNYFVMLRGSADGGGQLDGSGESIIVNASDDYVRVVGDPSGRPGRVTTDQTLELGRFGTDGTWWGQVTVVESIDLHDTKGFRLRNVHRASMNMNDATWSVAGSWVDQEQVALYGGSMGGGMSVDGPGHAAGWARIWAENGLVSLDRGSSEHLANYTIYEVEWGTEWIIQSVRVTGDSGGNKAGTPSDYDQGDLAQSVYRHNSFIVAYGYTSGTTPAAGWEGQIYSFGNGHWVNSKDNKAEKKQSQVSVGSYEPIQRDAQVYIHTHHALRVDHRYGEPGTIAAGTGGGAIAVDVPRVPDIYGDGTTGTLRFSILSNSSSGNSGPQPVVWSRHTTPSTVSWARNATAEVGGYWLQSIDFGGVWN